MTTDRLHDRTQTAFQCCHTMTEELAAAMERIECLIIERDAARARVRELEGKV